MDYNQYKLSQNEKFISFLRLLFLIFAFLYLNRFLSYPLGDLLFVGFIAFLPFPFILYKKDFLISSYFTTTLFIFDLLILLFPTVAKSVKNILPISICILFFLTSFLISNFKKSSILTLSVPFLFFLKLEKIIDIDYSILGILSAIILSSIIYGSFLGSGANKLMETLEEKEEELDTTKKLEAKIEELNGILSIQNFVTKIFDIFTYFFNNSEITIYTVENEICKAVKSTNERELNSEFELDFSQNIKKALEKGEIIYEKGKSLDENDVEFVYLPIIYSNKEINILAKILFPEKNLDIKEKKLLKKLFNFLTGYSKVVLRYENLEKLNRENEETLNELKKETFLYNFLGRFSRLASSKKEVDEIFHTLFELTREFFGITSLLSFRYDTNELCLTFDLSYPLDSGKDFENIKIKEGNKLWESFEKDKILIFGDILEIETTINKTLFNSKGIKSIITLPYNLNQENYKGVILLCFKNPYDFKKEELILLIEIRKLLEQFLKSIISPEKSYKIKSAIQFQSEIINEIEEKDFFDFFEEIKSKLENIYNFESIKLFLYKKGSFSTLEEEYYDEDISQELWEVFEKKSRKIKKVTDKYLNEKLFSIYSPIIGKNFYGVLYLKGYFKNFDKEILNLVDFTSKVISIKIDIDKKLKLTHKASESPENLNMFLSKIEEELKITKTTKYSIAMIDINNLSQINRTKGLQRGDELIKITENLINKYIPSKTGFIYNNSPGSYIAYFRNTGVLDGIKILRKILNEVETNFEEIKLNMGLSSFPRHGNSLKEIFFSAEDSLKEAKKRGKNNIFFPQKEFFLMGTEQKSVDFKEEIEKILGSKKTTGPHTVEELNEFISTLIKKRLNLDEIGIILHRLVLKVDYPENEGETYQFVPELSFLIGKKIGLSKTQLAVLKFASLFYDIGKFYVEGKILYAPRNLKQEEKKNIVEHVNVGVIEILMPHKIFNPVLKVIKFHHENWDGSGYPWQLKEDEIPIESRILFLVDSFKALITNRPYRKRSDIYEALKIINSLKKKHFDPKLVKILNEIYGYNEQVS